MSGEPFLVGLRLVGRRAVAVGDGPAVVRRARDLARTGADLIVLTTHAASADALVDAGIAVEHRAWRAGDFALARIVVLCVDGDREAMLDEAHAVGALVYVPDVPDESDLILTAIVRRGPLQIAISTGGHSPAAARRLAERTDASLPATAEATITAMSDARRELKAGADTDFPEYERWAAALDAGLDAPDQPAARAAVRTALGLGAGGS